jgi:hypothetical protein
MPRAGGEFFMEVAKNVAIPGRLAGFLAWARRLAGGGGGSRRGGWTWVRATVDEKYVKKNEKMGAIIFCTNGLSQLGMLPSHFRKF